MLILHARCANCLKHIGEVQCNCISSSKSTTNYIYKIDFRGETIARFLCDECAEKEKEQCQHGQE